MKPRLIAFSGLAGAGKDTAAQILTNHGWLHDSFAKPLKQMAEHINPTIELGVSYDGHGGNRVVSDLEHLLASGGWEKAKKVIAVREFLQDLGVAAREYIWQDIWVHSLEWRWEDANMEPTVITDCRFENEAQWVKGVGGRLIWIDRPGLDKVNEHSSESGVCRDLADIILVNDGTIEELWEKVQACLTIAA